MPWCCEGDNSMILDISDAQIAQLTDTDLRTLIGHLCEREVVTTNISLIV
jgi:hypothetical protein